MGGRGGSSKGHMTAKLEAWQGPGSCLGNHPRKVALCASENPLKRCHKHRKLLTGSAGVVCRIGHEDWLAIVIQLSLVARSQRTMARSKFQEKKDKRLKDH